MAPATWHGTRSLATECFEAADGDFEIALLLALDWRDKFREPGPRAREAAALPSTDTHASAQALPEAAPPGPLTNEQVAA